jgi:hypothetical protein
MSETTAVNEMAELGIDDLNKSRKKLRARLACFGNAHIAWVISQSGSLRDQWRILRNTERILRKDNKARKLSESVILSLIDCLRPDAPANGKPQKKGK